MRIRWTIQLLAGLRATANTAVVERFRTHKTGALLGYLAYHLGQAPSREVLTELLWPDDSLEAARHKLSVALSSLRHQLEPPGVPDQWVLIADRARVRLNPEAVATDVGEFERSVRLSHQASSDPDRVRALRAAVDRYGGTLLPGYYEDWLLPEQRRLEALYFECARRLIHLLAEQGDLAEALQYGIQALAIDPLREENHRLLVRLYEAAGQPEAALRQYADLQRLLKQELGTVPSEESRKLASAVQRRMAEQPPPSPFPPAPRSSPPPPAAAAADLDPVGGAVPLDSPFYITRTPDTELVRCIQRRTSIVLLKGPRQVGKTSLLARGLQSARSGGARVACTDLQLLNAAQFASAEVFLQSIARSILEQLELATPLSETWRCDDGPNMNFRRFMRAAIRAAPERPLVWALDDADRLLTSPFGSEVFALLRAWHNERALDPGSPWSQLTLIIAYATEAHLFITDLNQSPFNVGTPLVLEDFDAGQVGALNASYGQPLKNAAEIGAFYRLAGGHPYLVRRGLLEMTSHGLSLRQLEAQSDRDDGIYGNHLRRIHALLARDGEVWEAVRALLTTGQLPGPTTFYRLRASGVLAGDTWQEARPRCELYARYLRKHLA